jgi:predicted helicase
MGEKPDLIDELLEENSARRKRQQELDIRVIMGNPPYSAGQESANDNNANVQYPKLDERIRSTYAARSSATNKNALYDSYIRAIRWSSDRIKDRGVIGFVTNGGFIEVGTADGLRKCLVEDFSNLYVFHLRGNQRTSGERSRKEGGKIFGSGSRAPIAISILVKNPQSEEHGKIYFHDIGDYLSREQKLEIVSEFGSISGITRKQVWQALEPDEFGDWLNQRDPNFDTYIGLGNKKDRAAKAVFEIYSRGVATARDTWCYNSSNEKLEKQMRGMIAQYDSDVERAKRLHPKGVDSDIADSLMTYDTSRISWNRSLRNDFIKLKVHTYDPNSLYTGLYRPFSKSPVYFNRSFNDMVYQMHKFFPEPDSTNLVIYISGSGSSGRAFSALVTNVVPDLNMQHSGGQGFPLYHYEKTADDIFNQNVDAKFQRKDAITNDSLAYFQSAYPGANVQKEDIFYYVYGLLHSDEYRERYSDNLSKQFPRIPRMKEFADFAAFSKSGRELAELHINYESVSLNTQVNLTGTLRGLRVSEQAVKGGDDEDFYVSKMKFAKKGDKSKVIYNSKIIIENIPEEAYDYVVNGKPALEWVIERQAVTTDKKSGIVNDANDWAIETMGNARYPLELFLRVINVSLRTQEIVRNLPKLDAL